ncbi:hypothetical protein [Clostridium tetani]|uniref:Phage protein n=1 Tax=Clostridium tetani TaxID=1513 RepID=A0ABY0EVW8_CLOTA|nr:hypothetical protein [Clostridium tetani]RXI58994.1 hypothetical protein DP131_00550 [Clostridium tetani]
MEIVEYRIESNTLTVGFKENNFVVYSVIPYIKNKNKNELLQEAYINVKNTINYEKALEKHSFTTNKKGEEFTPEEPKAIKLDVDFNNLKGNVLDQYGDVFSTDIIFSIEGTDKARIQDNSIIEEDVKEDTEYYIVAKYKELEEKEERIMEVKRLTEVEMLEEEVNSLKKDRTISMKAMIELHTKIMKLEGKI